MPAKIDIEYENTQSPLYFSIKIVAKSWFNTFAAS